MLQIGIPLLSQSFVAPVPAILARVAGLQFKMSEYLHKNINMKNMLNILNIKYKMSCLCSVFS